MPAVIRILKYIFPLIFFVFLCVAGCASASKSKFNHNKKSSSCSLSDLVGPDKYYYSEHYQRKLKRSMKNISKK
jgi:hypothetical protein